LKSLIDVARTSLEWYTERSLDQLFDHTTATETSLLAEIKHIFDELSIVSHIEHQQAKVIEPFIRDMLNESIDTSNKDFHVSTRLESQTEELQKSANATYIAVGVGIQ
jgi:hypothetical protein